MVLALFGPGRAEGGPPEIVSIRVSAERSTTFFPPGTELIGLSYPQFVSLRAAAAARGAETPPAPQLVRAKHLARWDGTSLIGETDLVVPELKAGGPDLLLEPWNAAITAVPEGFLVLTGDDGRVRLRRTASPAAAGATSVASLKLRWQLRGESHNQGWALPLALPQTAVSELTVDLPDAWEPQARASRRVGPLPGPSKGRALWTFAGPASATDLRLMGQSRPLTSSRAASLWYRSSTRIDVTESSASWSADLETQAGPWASRQLRLELDRGLDVIEITGAAVEEYHAVSDGGPTERIPGGQSFVVTLRPESPEMEASPESTGLKLTVRALATVPAEGRWLLPSIRVENAEWTGGTTRVSLSPSRTVGRVEELAGIQSALHAPEAGSMRVFLFESDRPGPVAALELRKPRADVSAQVQGRLELGRESPTLEARVVWQVYRGRPQDLDIELPRTWSAESVEIEGSNTPAAWHPDARPDGESLVRIAFPSGDWSGRPLALTLRARSRVLGGRGPFSLPRVRPLGVPVTEESWVAWSEPGMTLQPRTAQGLAWIDPEPVRDAAGSPAADLTRANPSAPFRPALAWRWVGERGEAQVDRDWIDAPPSAQIEVTCRAGADRTSIEARIEISDSDQMLRSVDVGVLGSQSGSGTWRFLDAATGESLDSRELNPAERQTAQLPDGARGWHLTMASPQRGRIVILARRASRASDPRNLPLLVLPRRYQWMGKVVVLTAPSLLTTTRTQAVRVLDPDLAWESFHQDAAGNPSSASETNPATALRRAHAFRYESAEASIELETAALAPTNVDGLIRDVTLTTWVTPGFPTRHRLRMQVVPTRANSLSIGLPNECVAERLTRDDETVVPIIEKDALSVPLLAGASAGSRGLVRVVVDYRETAETRGDSRSLSPSRPVLSMPCLSLTWEVVVPAGWRVRSLGGGWTPVPSPSSPSRAASWPGWGSWPGTRRGSRAKLPIELDRRVAAVGSQELSLGDWFTRWDAGATPVVLDRWALNAGGFGPRSRVTPASSAAATSRDAQSWLGPLGLSALMLGRVAVITSREQAAEFESLASQGDPAFASYERAAGEAVAWGSDLSDRFESVNRWLQETTPKAVPDRAPKEGPEGPRAEGIHRFVSAGWPDREDAVEFDDATQSRGWAWFVALGVVAIGLTLPGRYRLIGPVVAGVVAAIGAWVLSLPFPTLVEGLTGGFVVLAALAFAWSLPARGELSALWRRRRNNARPRRTRSALVRSGGLLGLILLGAWASGWAQVAPSESIVALLLYDGTPDPTRAPDRVVMRLADYRRLSQDADQPRVEPRPSVMLTNATHRFRWKDNQTVVIESELLLLTAPTDGGIAPWRLPVEGAREIRARVDGVATPVRIVDGGRTAEVRLDDPGGTGPPPGLRRLVVSREVLPRWMDRWQTVNVEVNPAVSARVEAAPATTGEEPEFPRARGLLDPATAGEAPSTLYGPARRVEVRWRAPSVQPPVRATSAVDAQILWDALPAGDRARARLSFRTQGGTSAVRFQLESESMIRPLVLPAGADVSVDSTTDPPTWVIRFSPPLPDGSTILVDVWRPRDFGRDSSAGPTARTMPRLELLDVDRFTASVGFRRPPDWVGRLGSPQSPDSVADEAFVRAWKSLPDDGLTLAGAVRLATLPTRENLPRVETGPPPRRFRLKSAVRAVLEPGRISLRAQSEIHEIERPIWETVLTCPSGFVATHVAADGLTDWSREASRLRLRFDGAVSPGRNVVIEGFLPQLETTDSTESAQQEVATPWFLWQGATEELGRLVVASPTRVETVASALEEVAPASATTTFSAGQVEAREATYIVPPGADLGRLRWERPRPRVNVLIDSRLRIDPDSVEWVADVRYDVWGRSLDAINLRLPVAWARAATLQLLGTTHQRVSEVRGEFVDWSIRPDRPVWGTQRLTIRATVPFGPDSPQSFPELRPLGRGGVDSYLRILNVTRQGLVVEGSPGLQPIAPSAIPRDPLFRAPDLTGSTIRTYRVIRPGWTLRVARSRETPHGEEGEGTITVDGAAIEGTLQDDGRFLGLAHYLVAAHTDPFLEIRFPEGAQPIWASVNDSPSMPQRTPRGTWQVMLGDDSRNQVRVAWVDSSRPGGPKVADRAALLLPRLAAGPVETLIQISARDGITLAPVTPALRAIGLERVPLIQAEWLETAINAALDDFDRGSRRDGEDLVAALVKFGLKCREAERVAAWEPALSPSDHEARLLQAQLTARRLHGDLQEALQTASLDDYGQAAQLWLGLEPGPKAPDGLAPTPGREPALVIRAIGRPHAFAGTIAATSDGFPTLRIAGRPVSQGSALNLIPLFLGIALLTLGLSATPERAGVWPSRLGFVVLMGIAALQGGPIGLGGTALLAIVGKSAPAR